VIATTRNYPAYYFEQTDVATFLGALPLGSNRSITIDVVSGSLFLYGATADNRTHDPALQFAKNIL
jgi:flagellar biogenesis protein FliO